MPKVLNPVLYRRLVRQFGAVKVSSASEEIVMKAVVGLDDEPRLAISHAGEYYQVNCPYCNDTRQRLYVNHMFGQVDPHGRRITFLAICYNEGCLFRAENQRDFLDRLDDIGLKEAIVRPGTKVPEEAREVVWPGPCYSLDKLRRNHPARLYMQSRKYDPDLLGRKHQVSWCKESHYSLAQNRIIIPIFDRDKLKGWQARYIGDLDWKGPRRKELPPKYWSCPDSDFRSKCIYNFDRMKKWETAVIVEGPTDVYNFGDMSGCIFGNTMTETQQRRLLAVFRQRTVVLLLDPEEYESRATKRLIETMTAKMPGRFCAVKLPDGTDPGSLDRSFSRPYVKAEAKRQGVKVTYKKVVL